MNSRQRRKREAERYNQELANHKAWLKKRALEPRRKRAHSSKMAMLAAMVMLELPK